MSSPILKALSKTLSRVDNSITSLNLSSIPHSSRDGFETFISSIRDNTTLIELDISINIVGPSVVSLLQNNGLQRLNISSTNIENDDMIRIFQALKSNNTLVDLDVSSVLCNEKYIPYVSSSLKENTTLEKLNLSYNIIAGDEVDILADGIRKSKSLKTLLINGLRGVGRVGKKQLIHAIAANPPLTHFGLSYLLLEAENHSELTKALKANTRLQHLTLKEQDANKRMDSATLETIQTIFQGSMNLSIIELNDEDPEMKFYCKNLESRALKEFPQQLLLMNHLISINISDNLLTILPDEISQLTNLKDLDISFNRLVALPTSLGYMSNLKSLKLNNNPFKTPPPEIVKAGLRTILGYLRDLDTGSESIYRTKIMMVGQENIGKTTLLKAIKKYRHQKWTPKRTSIKPTISTDGIDIAEWTIEVQLDNERDSMKPLSRATSFIGSRLSTQEDSSKKMVSISAWDFAGQEIYYTTHQFFLSQRSIFILVWDLRYDEEACKVSYWLQSIRSRTKNCPVVIVGTHADELSNPEEAHSKAEKVRRKYQKRFPFIKASFGISCKHEADIQNLVSKIKDIIRDLPYIGEMVPKCYNEMERLIKKEAMDSKIGRQDNPPIRSISELVKLGSYCNILSVDKLKRCIKFLHDIGSLIYFDDPSIALGDLVVIEPQFLTNVMSTIITTKNNIKDGIMNKSMFPIIWRPPQFPESIHNILINLLEKFEIVFLLPVSLRAKLGHKRNIVAKIKTDNISELEKEASEDLDILVPCILPLEKPEFDLYWIGYDLSKIQFDRYYKFDFVPKGFFSRLIIRCLHFVDSVSVYWRHGLIAERDRDMIFLEMIPEESTLKISVRGPRDNPPTDTLRICIEMVDVLIGMNSWFHVERQIFVPCSHCKENRIEESMVRMYNITELGASLSRGEFLVRCSNDDKNVHISRLIPEIVLMDLERSKIPFEEIELQEEIGKGAFGVIHKGFYCGQEIAVKTMKNRDEVNEKSFQDFRKEAYMMSGMKHPNIVNMIGFCLEPFSIVMEYLPCGNLYKHLKVTKNQPSNWEFILKVALDVARGMHYLHDSDPPFIHRDLKSPNIILVDFDPNSEICAKIADFGLSSRMYIPSLQEKSSNRNVGNPIWLAPEIINEDEFTEKSDIYSYGIILWELYTKEHPFAEYNYNFMFELEDMIKSGKRPSIPADMPEPYSSLIQACWCGDPCDRPSFMEIVKRIVSISADLAPGMSIPEDIFADIGPSKRDTANTDQNSIDADNEVIISGQLVKQIKAETVVSLCLVDSNIWGGTTDGSILVWNAKNGQLISCIDAAHKSRVTKILYSDEKVYTVAYGDKIKVWKTVDPDVAREKALLNEQSVSKRGFIFQKVGLRKKKRIMEIKNKKLYMYKEDGETSVLASDLESLSFVSEQSSKKCAFVISTKNNKHYNMICQSKDEQNEWLSAFKDEMEKKKLLYDITHVKDISCNDIRSICMLDQHLWCGTVDMRLKVWSTETLELVKNVPINLIQHAGSDIKIPLQGIAFQSDKIWLAMSSYLVTLDRITLLPLRFFQAHNEPITFLNIVNSTLWTSSEDCSLKIWDTVSCECAKTFLEIEAPQISMIKHGNSIWTSGRDGSIKIFNLDTLEFVRSLEDKHRESVTALCRSGRTIWASCLDGTVSIWS